MPSEKDRSIENRIQAKLDNHKEFNGYGLEARARKGHVQVSGVVDTLADSKRAEKMIKSIDGVRGLENNLVLSTDGAVTDPGTVMEVTDELQADPRVDTKDVGVGEVAGGRAYLQGNASTEDEVDAAVQDAAKARGVKGVVNQVKISPREYDTGDPEFIFHHQVNNDKED
ncbi:MAG: BON domain-containing protein [Clostridiales bacterium]|nr:BON domain-containing protein [Clostridiales bacterium]MCF8022983.1 BON domain-containing protein [Clostridiales bacterium]